MSDPLCMWCDEPVAESDLRALPISGGMMHRECGIRMVLGSVAHLERRCSCFVDIDSRLACMDDPPGDPPGMTRREAARAAVELATRQGKLANWPGPDPV